MDLDRDCLDLTKLSIKKNVVRKLPLSMCGLTSLGTVGIKESYTIVVNKEHVQHCPISQVMGGDD